MEEEIKKWKDMWKEETPNTVNSLEIIKQLNTIEKKAKFQRIKLLIALIVLVISSFVFTKSLISCSFSIPAYVLLVIGILIKLIPLYRTKYGIIKDQSDLNNEAFLKKLRDKMAFKTKHLIIYMLVLMMALNFALLCLYEQGTIFNFPITDDNRIYFHLSTIILFSVAYISNKKHMDANKRRTSNLIKDLENNNLEN